MMVLLSASIPRIKFPLHIASLLLVIGLSSCSTQTKGNDLSNENTRQQVIGGGCEGCELMYTGMPENITSESISDGWNEGNQKLIITGKVYRQDGKTPAPDVVVYYWHTDDDGLYSSKATTPQEVKAHGHLRGWVKSDEYGNYTIKTSRPAHYPNENIAQHIHLSIKEPQLPNQYFADLYFDDDPLYLTHKKKYGQQNRAGTEVLHTLSNEGIEIAEHNILLGMNIPYYPATNSNR